MSDEDFTDDFDEEEDDNLCPYCGAIGNQLCALDCPRPDNFWNPELDDE